MSDPIGPLPPIPHVTRNAALGGQPWPWAVAESSTANGRAAYVVDGVLLGWQGWDFNRNSPTWRYWDGDLFGRRWWIRQDKDGGDPYWWEAWWFEPEGEYPSLAFKREFETPDGMPWSTVIEPFPWIGTIGSFDNSWLPDGVTYHWYRTAADAVAAWPDCLRQDDYLATYGVYWL